MISVSDAWKDIQQRFLLPETYIEIDYAITDEGAQESATGTGTNEASFSNAGSILNADATITKYATNELNLWALDGTCAILPTGARENAGYVSDIESTGSVTLSFPEVRETAVAGVTITWSEAFAECPSVFTVTAKNRNTVVAETTVTDNTARVSEVSLKLANYDSITVAVHNWFLPHRRARIEKVSVGHVLTLTKNDILSFTHEQHGDLLSGELPKYSIEFTLDNSDGRWNPNNPSGMEQYLSERQRLSVRYGLDVNGTVEWIKAGTFYLSEWDAPSNGLEARFVARDMLEFLVNADVSGSSVYGNLDFLARWATSSTLPSEATVVLDAALADSAGRSPTIEGTAAEVLQKCAHAACCVLRYDRDGVLYVERLNKALTEYRIPLSLSYTHTEVTLSKPLKTVTVDYGGEVLYKKDVAATGETQTVTNDYINAEDKAAEVAEWVSDVLKSRTTVSGEFRADPRLDLFDVVTVESKYGAFAPVVITNIKYTFTGAFHGSFTGRVLEE